MDPRAASELQALWLLCLSETDARATAAVAMPMMVDLFGGRARNASQEKRKYKSPGQGHQHQ